MNARAPCEDELLALLQEKLPQELTQREVGALRVALKTMPAIREALVESLVVEHGVAARFAPELQDIESLFRRVAEERGARQRRRWRVGVWLVLVGLCVAAGAVAIVQMVGRRPAPQVRPPAVARTERPPVATSRPKPGETRNPKATSLPAPPPAPAAPLPLEPPWHVFHDRSLRGDDSWQRGLHRVLLPIGGATLALAGEGEGTVLRGTFAVVPPAPDGRSVRLRMASFTRLRWSFWQGQEGVLVEYLENAGTLRALAVRRLEGEGPPAFVEGASNLDVLREGSVRRIDPAIDFAWGGASPVGDGGKAFSARWRGLLTVPEGGKWNLYVTTGGSVSVHADGQLVIRKAPVADGKGQADTSRGKLWAPVARPREKNPRTFEIQIDYADQASGGIRLEWDRPARRPQGNRRTPWDRPLIPRQVVPATAFHTRGESGESTPGLAGAYGPDPDISRLGRYKVLHLVDDDQGAWHNRHAAGAVDIRYEAGAVRVARGEEELLVLPMAQPPEKFVMETSGRLANAELCRLPPLDTAGRRKRLASKSETKAPTDFEWTITPKAPADLVTKRAEGGSSLEFARSGGELAWDAVAGVAQESGCEVTMRIDAATVGTGVFVGDPSRESDGLRLYVAQHKIARVLCRKPSVPADVSAHHEKGWIIGQAFWVRFTVSLNDVRLAFSNNGVSWIPASERLLAGSRSIGERIRFGVAAAAGADPRAIRVGELRTRRYQGLEGLGNPKWIALTSKLLRDGRGASPNGSGRYESLIRSRPEQASPGQWEIACRLAMLGAPTPSHERQQHVWAVLRAAAGNATAWQRLEPALLEVPLRMNLSERPSTWAALAAFYVATAEQYWPDADLRRRIPDLVDAWHTQGPGIRRRTDNVTLNPFPLELARLNLYALADGTDVARLWSTALREDFLSVGRDGRHFDYRRELGNLAMWMQAKAGKLTQHEPTDPGPQGGPPGPQVSDEVGVGRGQPAYHPLVAESHSRELQNLVQEVNSAIESKDWRLAGEAIVREPLLGNVASGVHDGDVLVSMNVLVRRWIDRHPELAEALRTREHVGRLRLNLAIRRHDLPLLESVALQFLGTNVGNAAQARLADRELSMRECLSAAERYRMLIATASGPAKQQWQARHRLAMALAGQEVGRPTTRPVDLTGRSLSPAQFEEMVSRALKGRRTSSAAPSPGPGQLAPALRSLSQVGRWSLDIPAIPPWRRQYGDRRLIHYSGDFGWAFQGQQLFIHQPGRLTSYNVSSGAKRLDVSQPIESGTWPTRDLARPLVLGGRLFVPLYWGSRVELTCVDGETGKVVWRQPLDDTILGEPVECDGTILTLSFRRSSVSGILVFRRVDPDTGQSLLAREVTQVQLGDLLFRVGRPIVHQGSVLFRSGCGVVCCDLLGGVRWIRQLPFTPPAIEQDAYNSRSLSGLLVAGDRVIMSSPGSWNVECRDIGTGERRWIYPQPSLRKVVGLTKNRVILVTGDEIQAIEVARGEVVWRRPWKGAADSILLTEDGVILAPASPGQGEGGAVRIDRFASADGSPMDPLKMAGGQAMPAGVDRLFTDGRHVVCARRVKRGDSWRIELTVLKATTPPAGGGVE